MFSTQTLSFGVFHDGTKVAQHCKCESIKAYAGFRKRRIDHNRSNICRKTRKYPAVDLRHSGSTALKRSEMKTKKKARAKKKKRKTYAKIQTTI